MKLSIIIAVLDSHEIVIRQVKYFASLPLPTNTEVIFIDDGSEPSFLNHKDIHWFARDYPWLTILETGDKRDWTQGLARMEGVKAAYGKYIFCTDIDHIISKEAIDFSLSFDGDKAVFRRRFAYLNEDGGLVRDKQKLLSWGLNPTSIRDNELSDGVHGNTWLMRKKVFGQLGGYNLGRCNSGSHLQGEDREFNSRWARASKKKKVYKEQVEGPPIYFFPSGRYHVNGEDNPHGLFHELEHTKWQ